MKNFIVFFVALLIFTSCGRDENVIAEVDGKPIMKSDYEMEYAVYREINARKFGEDLLNQVQDDGKTLDAQLKEGVLQKMIIEKIISEEMIASDYEITPEELENTTKEYYEKLGGEEKAKAFIKESGMTEEFFKESIKKSIYVNRHKAMVLGELNVTEDEIKNYYNENAPKFEQVECSYILLKTEEEARDVKSKILSGIAFEDLAIAKSLDPQTGVKGGSLGWIKRGEYPKEFENAAFNMKAGDISDPIQSDLGFYIIKVSGIKQSYEELKDDIKKEYETERYEKYLDDAQKNADIKIYTEEK